MSLLGNSWVLLGLDAVLSTIYQRNPSICSAREVVGSSRVCQDLGAKRYAEKGGKSTAGGAVRERFAQPRRSDQGGPVGCGLVLPTSSFDSTKQGCHMFRGVWVSLYVFSGTKKVLTLYSWILWASSCDWKGL